MATPRYREFRSPGFWIALLVIALPASCIFQVDRFDAAARPFKELGGTVQASGDGASAILGPAGVNYIDLSGTSVRDADLRKLGGHLEKLSGLWVLSLSRTSVTDAGLAYLQRLSQLKKLDLSATKVTEQGVARLRKALPDVRIQMDVDNGVPVGP